MMTTELSAIQRNQIESARLAHAVAEFEKRGGQVIQAGEFNPKQPRRRSEWIDPATVLNRKGAFLGRAERDRLRIMAESL